MIQNEFITPVQIAIATGKSVRFINITATKEGWPARIVNKRGEKEFEVSRLPAEIQEALFHARYEIDHHDIEKTAMRLEIRVLPEKLKDPNIASKIRLVSDCMAVPKRVRGRRERIKQIAEGHGYSVKTAYNLMKRVEAGKWLVKPTKNYGTNFTDLGITVRAWDEEAGRMAVQAIMGNKRNHVEKLALYHKVARQCRDKDLRFGSYRSFLDMAKRMNGAVIAYRDKGIRGLREDIVPAIQRDFTAYRPMECLIGDQHKADYFAIDGNGDMVTLELFCWLDFRTQLAWPAIAYKHYNRYTVGQAFINAVRWGVPSIVYTDWGKPEESKYTTLLLDQLTGLGIKAEGIRHTHAKVRHPQAKPIESWFGWLDRKMRNAGIPGYCKRLKDSRENEIQQKELKEQVKANELLRIPELVERVTGEIEGWNIHFFKNRGPDTGKSPLQIYNEEVKAHPVTTLSEDVLDYIFLPFYEVTIRRSQVKIRHEFLKKTLTYYHPELANHNGADVTVRYNPFDPEAVWIFREGKLICQAEGWGVINPKNTEHVRERIAKQNSLIKQVSEIYKAHKPEEKTIPRISPHEREARQLKRAQELRIIRTQLDEIDMSTGEVLTAQGARRKAQDCGEYRPLFELKRVVHGEEPKRLSLFRSTIDDARSIDEDE